jgi:hypothetical protein
MTILDAPIPSSHLPFVLDEQPHYAVATDKIKITMADHNGCGCKLSFKGQIKQVTDQNGPALRPAHPVLHILLYILLYKECVSL